jgi:hypothetical protein
MAVKNGDNQTIFQAGGKYPPGEYNGNVKMLMDTYTFPGAVFSASDFILIGTLPVGARVVGAGIRIPASLGTTGIFDLGTDADPNGFVSGCDGGGQAAVKQSSTEALIGTKYSVETDVKLDCTEATDVATGLTVTAWVKYVVD